jgi:hypothetical protein
VIESHFHEQCIILYQRGDVIKKWKECPDRKCWVESASRTTWRINSYDAFYYLYDVCIHLKWKSKGRSIRIC